ncbi:MAG: hypothetical protein Q9160_005527 [Pyrenula sp. 1 TL-2023]
MDRPSLPSRDQTLTLKDQKTNKIETLTLNEALALIRPGTALIPVVPKDTRNAQRNPNIETQYYILPLRLQGLDHVGVKQAKRAGNTNELHFTTKESARSVHTKLAKMHHLLKVGRQVEVHVRPGQKCRDPALLAAAFSNSLHLHPAALSASIPEGCKMLGEALRDKKTGGVISMFMSAGWPGPKATRQVGKIRNFMRTLKNWVVQPEESDEFEVVRAKKGGNLRSKKYESRLEKIEHKAQASHEQRSSELEDSVLKRGAQLHSKEYSGRPENDGQKAQVSRDAHGKRTSVDVKVLPKATQINDRDSLRTEPTYISRGQRRTMPRATGCQRHGASHGRIRITSKVKITPKI